jgi:glutamate racemase
MTKATGSRASSTSFPTSARNLRVMDPRPIGVFDSGFGGLTVARALIDLLPNERLVYVGDTGRYPYGSKPLADLRDYAHEITEWLIETHGVKLVVVACNTASAAALDDLQASFPTPIVGVIDAGVRSLLSVSETHHVGVIGTVGTIGSGAYQAAVSSVDDSVLLTCAACPGFVEFVERGELASDQVRVLAQRLLSPIVDAKVDALLLGCTHYPFLARTISDVVGRDVVLVSSADETAFQVRNMLLDLGSTRVGSPEPPIFLSSGDVGEFERIGRMLLGPEVHEVGIWNSEREGRAEGRTT